MAGKLSKFLRFIGIEETDDMDEEYYEEDERAYGRDRDYEDHEERGFSYDRKGRNDRREREERSERGSRNDRYEREHVMHSEDVEESFPNGREQSREATRAEKVEEAYARTAGMKMIVYHPMSYADCQSVILSLVDGKPVVVNLTEIEQAIATRILDFLSGAVFALDGTIVRVSEGIFLATPKGCDVVGEGTPDREDNEG